MVLLWSFLGIIFQGVPETEGGWEATQWTIPFLAQTYPAMTVSVGKEGESGIPIKLTMREFER